MTRRRCRRCAGEDGVFLVLWTVLLLGIFLMVAIVVDLGGLRADRRAARSAADAAAVAGGADLFSGAEQACETAWSYALENLNLHAADFTTTQPACSDFASITCSPTTIVTKTGTAGPYTISISNPVPDGDPLLDAEAVGPNISQPAVTTSDGDACDRLGVKITRSRETLFARVGGHTSNTTGGHSVGLMLSGIEGVPASLVVLDPHRCPAISSSGNGGIEVTGTSPTLTGAILAVSDGTGASCSSPPPYVLDVQSGATGSHVTITDPGDIYLAALGGGCAAPACDPNELDITNGYFPAPIKPKDPPSRGLVDHKYNCLGDYSTAGNYRVVHERGVSGAILPACTGTAAGYVNAVFTAVRAGNLQPPTGTYTTYTDCSPAVLPPVLPGNSRIDCALPNNVVLTVNGSLWINNAAAISPRTLTVNGNAVFGGPVSLSTNNTLTVNGNAEFRGAGAVSVSGSTSNGGRLTIRGSGLACDAATLLTSAASCVRSSSTTESFVFLGPNVTSFSLNGGNVDLAGTIVFGEGGTTATSTTGPVVSVGGGGNISWVSPSTGPFEDLLAWSDKVTDYTNNASVNATSHNLAGSGTVTMTGVFFTPTAAVRFTGTTDITPVRAQFWANTLHQDGNGRFLMTPDGSFVPVPVAEGSRLIR